MVGCDRPRNPARRGCRSGRPWPAHWWACSRARRMCSAALTRWERVVDAVAVLVCHCTAVNDARLVEEALAGAVCPAEVAAKARKGAVWGKRGSVRLDLGGRRHMNNKKKRPT